MDNTTSIASCQLGPEEVVDAFITEYKTVSALTACSTSLYGFNVALAISCLRLLFTHKDATTSRRRRTLTCLYIAAMIAIASQAVVDVNMSLDGGVIDSLRNPVDPQKFRRALFGPKMPLSLPLAVWGADTVLIYRCMILYRLASFRRRVLLYIYLCIAAVGSLGSGAASYYLGFVFGASGYPQVVFSGLIFATIVVNGTVALLIAARLIYAERLLSRSLDEKRSDRPRPYMTALAICVESSALIVVVAVASVIRGRAVLLLPQISVLSPLLILYRVAQGRADKIIARLEETLDFHFTRPASVVSEVAPGDR